MSQKLLKILLLIILTIGIVIFGIVLVRAKNKKNQVNIVTNIENPFGLSTEDVSLADRTPPLNRLNNEPDLTSSSDLSDFTSFEDNPVFRRLSEDPVSLGAVFTYIEREIAPPEEASEDLVEVYDFTGYPTLRFGDERKEVSDLKTILNRQTPSPALSLDEVFDVELKNAVIDFQAKNNLKPDAIVGSGTYKALNDFQGIKPKAPEKKEFETIEFVRMVNRSNGNIYEKATKIEESKTITLSSIPRVYESYFSGDRKFVLIRYLREDGIENYVAELKNPDFDTGIFELAGRLLPKEISFVSPLSNNQKIIYLIKENNGSSLVSYDFKTDQSRKIWSSKFSDWMPAWPEENLVLLTDRSSGLVATNSYLLDVRNNSLKKVISNTFGLTTNISPNGKKIIFSSYESNQLKTKILDVPTGVIKDFTPITLPEKCVWSKDSSSVYCGAPSNIPSGVYPDDWYKGETLFRDTIWQTDIESLLSRVLIDSARLNYPVDIIDPKINDKEDYFIFVNKHDNFLYGIDLSRL